MPMQIFQGLDQTTSAVKALWRKGLGVARSATSRPRKRSKKRSASSGTNKRTKRTKRASGSSRRSKGSAMKKGSAAAKAWGKKMAKLRKS